MMSNLIRTILAVNRQPRNVITTTIRNISRTTSRNEKPSVTVTETVSNETAHRIGTLTYIVKPYQKYALVWAGKYKSVADVPERLPHGVLDNAINRARIKIAIYMMILTILGAGAAVYSGKKAVASGQNLAKIGIEQQKALREEGIREKAAAEAAAAAAKSSQ